MHGSSEVEALTARLEAVAILDDAEQGILALVICSGALSVPSVRGTGTF